MEINEYVSHYLKSIEFWKFLGLSFAVVLFAFAILCIYACTLGKRKYADNEQTTEMPVYYIVEKFCELIFSGTSILMFMAGYYMIERFLAVDAYLTVWNKYKDFLLLLFIIISCIFNSILDRVLIRLKHLKSEDKAPIRLLGMLYMILIFCYIKFIYENNNYDFFISYFLGLMVGRFVYFDASFKGFIEAIKEAAKNIPLLILALGCTGILSLYGFTTKYLIKHIGVLTNVFFLHLFMCVAIFVLYHLPLLKILSRSKTE